MANKVNYHAQLKNLTQAWQREGRVPRILLHSCCAPCSSTCLEFLSDFAELTVFYFNPNITDKEEYLFRLTEQERLIREMSFVHPVGLIAGDYEPERFLAEAQGLEKAPERGPRCVKCYSLRLNETAKLAAGKGFDYFATTLTLSPLKPSDLVNERGFAAAELYPGADYLPTDFKKDNGYLRSIELSKQYNLYRQNYCGCIYSKQAAEDSGRV